MILALNIVIHCNAKPCVELLETGALMFRYPMVFGACGFTGNSGNI